MLTLQLRKLGIESKAAERQRELLEAQVGRASHPVGGSVSCCLHGSSMVVAVVVMDGWVVVRWWSWASASWSWSWRTPPPSTKSDRPAR